MGRFRLWQRMAQADVRQHKVRVDMVERQLLTSAVCPLAQRRGSAPDGRYRLAEAASDPLHKRGIDLTPQWAEHLLDRLDRAEHDAVLHVDEVPASHRLDHLRIEQLWPGHPAGLGRWTFVLTACWLHPVPIVGQQALPLSQ
jgi:hypothetical protein